jgi:hypothetical protein
MLENGEVADESTCFTLPSQIIKSSDCKSSLLNTPREDSDAKM